MYTYTMLQKNYLKKPIGKLMMERLFVYGTLAPGRVNEHILSPIKGSWETATATGTLQHEGWGADMGYPGFVLDQQGKEIHGFLLTSHELSHHWKNLDAFEGEAYERILITVKLENNEIVDAYIYALRK